MSAAGHHTIYVWRQITTAGLELVDAIQVNATGATFINTKKTQGISNWLCDTGCDTGGYVLFLFTAALKFALRCKHIKRTIIEK